MAGIWALSSLLKSYPVKHSQLYEAKIFFPELQTFSGDDILKTMQDVKILY